jgi:F-type H+-transporting ATPase subunit b
MKSKKPWLHLGWLSMGVAVGLLLWAADAQAAESAGHWRETYDLIMRWINFLILVAVIVKYARVPIKNFLKMRKAEVEAEMVQLEDEKNAVVARVTGLLQEGAASQAQLGDLKERILAEGERRKREIIEEARAHSVLILEEAKRKVDYKIISARQNFRDALVDAAADMALERLPAEVNSADQDMMLALFLDGVESHARQISQLHE